MAEWISTFLSDPIAATFTVLLCISITALAIAYVKGL